MIRPMNSTYACAVEVDEDDREIAWEHVPAWDVFLWMLLYGACTLGTHAYVGITPIHTRAWICVLAA